MRSPAKKIQFLLDPLSQDPPANWEEITQLVKHHRYYHMIDNLLSLYKDDVPPDTRILLKQEYQDQLFKQLQLAKELEEICNILNKEKLFYINLKGTALALQLYGKISARISRDIDFLINKTDISKFLHIFHERGYIKSKAERGKKENYFRKIKKNYTLIHPEKKIILELHWELFSNPYFYPSRELLKEESSQISLNGTAVRLMNRENTFLYLCMHGTYHEYFRLFWLRDIAEIIEKWDLDWNKIKQRANSEGIVRIVISSVILAGWLYKLPTPFDDLQHDRTIARIVDHNIKVINRSSFHDTFSRFQRIIYFFHLRKEWRYRFECFWGIGKRRWIRGIRS